MRDALGSVAYSSPVPHRFASVLWTITWVSVHTTSAFTMFDMRST
jgi:hypothetical protein